MRERHWPPPRAVPPKREYLDGGCRKGGLGGRAAGVAQAHIFFYERKKPATNIPIPHWRSVSHRWLVLAEYRPYRRQGFLNKKLHFISLFFIFGFMCYLKIFFYIFSSLRYWDNMMYIY